MRIHSYVFMEAQDAGKAVTEIAAQALKLFGELYYPYPREMLTIVAGFLHNMEMDGMVMISYGVFDYYNDTLKTNLTILTPHELSHQWFYSLIGNDQAKEPWLDEALATYHEVLYYQRYHPDLVQWWWDNRVSGFAPQGVATAISISQAAMRLIAMQFTCVAPCSCKKSAMPWVMRLFSPHSRITPSVTPTKSPRLTTFLTHLTNTPTLNLSLFLLNIFRTKRLFSNIYLCKKKLFAENL